MSEQRRDASVAVALSGGGHRAALFCLGALLYLVDSRKSTQVGSIASVSGGSLTNGWIAQGADLGSIEPQAFRAFVAPLASRLASKGTLQGRAMSKTWRNVSAVVLLLCFGVFAIPNVARWSRYWMFLGAVGLWAVVAIGPLLGTAVARVYGWFLVVSAIAAMVTCWVVPLSTSSNTRRWELAVAALASPLGRLGAFVVSVAAWAGLVASQRGRVCASAFRRRLFSSQGSASLLRDISGGLDHVFCATDLQSAEHVYFGKDFIYGYRFGKGNPQDLALHEAVQASANLPFAFPPKHLRAARFGLAYQDPTGRYPEPEDRPQPYPPKEFALTDGGVYDNMADQWAQGFDGRISSWPALETERHRPEELVVVNASAGLEWTRVRRTRIPLIGEVIGLLKIKDVLYDQTTAHRRWAMIGRFDRAAVTGQGLRGAVVSIGQSPFGAVEHFRRREVRVLWPKRGRWADEAWGLLQNSENTDDWERVARDNAAVPTVLCAMGEADTASLLRHGYLLAMANLHVVLGYPLPHTLPGIDEFRALARGEPDGFGWVFEPATTAEEV